MIYNEFQKIEAERTGPKSFYDASMTLFCIPRILRILLNKTIKGKNKKRFLVTLQDPRLKYKKKLYFYTIAMNNPKMKLRKFYLYNTYLSLTSEKLVYCKL